MVATAPLRESLGLADGGFSVSQNLSPRKPLALCRLGTAVPAPTFAAARLQRFANLQMLIGKKDASWFAHFARAASTAAGRPMAFAGAVAVLVLWAASGPLFGFSDTWQLIINTGTTIVTFLMVFLIQSSQNRDSEAIQVKLDELIRAIDGAQNHLLDLEELEEEDIERIRAEYRRLASVARSGSGSATGCPPAPH
jgi:low affinity Fe/Cu permease